ncbi:hypothetical protein BDV96DRAFT_647958 [Lophiotrema nucula]|uniref:Uncharacterized protein n=1 Tax=Lophiotrema nucula TaxID=690887 RepID=A0A6A5Z2S7_9PLEO|nr:hypothetical protein BDV96DRAFT_647958 [Lophiotrema nucula]
MASSMYSGEEVSLLKDLARDHRGTISWMAIMHRYNQRVPKERNRTSGALRNKCKAAGIHFQGLRNGRPTRKTTPARLASKTSPVWQGSEAPRPETDRYWYKWPSLNLWLSNVSNCIPMYEVPQSDLCGLGAYQQGYDQTLDLHQADIMQQAHSETLRVNGKRVEEEQHCD